MKLNSKNVRQLKSIKNITTYRYNLANKNLKLN